MSQYLYVDVASRVYAHHTNFANLGQLQPAVGDAPAETGLAPDQDAREVRPGDTVEAEVNPDPVRFEQATKAKKG